MMAADLSPHGARTAGCVTKEAPKNKKPAFSFEKAGMNGGCTDAPPPVPLRQPLFPFWVGGFASSGPPDFAFSVIVRIQFSLVGHLVCVDWWYMSMVNVEYEISRRFWQGRKRR
ncbi:hypothetical protein Ppro_0317 [Pelobacter propionicus DSM 2379]|uniref:Uncharacterized protein n=1 Tax=Pelobacter propionicus (strain DSM 2379 / NBRC 103807 / OttBd1) TaxID=338966 RepID=A1AKT1_PELPD|nr:hypothetical protein Ppro_0317 [Pelobacter propionicus DSM 2379]